MLFFDAFDQVSADQELKKLYSDVEVVKVIASKQNKNIYICIRSSRLISRSNIRKMEELLGKQLFLHTGNKAMIKPQFDLSAQYTLANLYPIYKDSILDEIKEESVVNHHIMSGAEITIEDLNMKISVIDNCVIRDKMSKLKDYLETLFQERFNYTVRVNVDYLEPAKKTDNHEQEYRKQMLRMSEKEAEEEGFQPVGNTMNENASAIEGNRFITQDQNQGGNQSNNTTRMDDGLTMNSNPNASGVNQEMSQNNTNASVTKSAAPVKTEANSKTSTPTKSDVGKPTPGNGSGGKSAYEKGKGSYRKLPTDPSVIYGRNFDGNSMSICDIIGEIGEVVIRGKLIKPESRTIGNDKSIVTLLFTDFTDSIKVKLYAKTIEVDEINSVLKPGGFYLLKGIAQMDTYERDITIGSVVGIKTISDFTTSRKDQAPKKRWSFMLIP